MAAADAPDVQEFLRKLELAANGTREEVPGWTLRRPSFGEVEERITFIVAESKPEEDVPFILPAVAEACICVIDGSVSIDSAPRNLDEGSFWTVHGGEGRAVHSLVHPTRIFCMFFKGGGDERGMDNR